MFTCTEPRVTGFDTSSEFVSAPYTICSCRLSTSRISSLSSTRSRSNSVSYVSAIGVPRAKRSIGRFFRRRSSIILYSAKKLPTTARQQASSSYLMCHAQCVCSGRDKAIGCMKPRHCSSYCRRFMALRLRRNQRKRWRSKTGDDRHCR